MACRIEGPSALAELTDYCTRPSAMKKAAAVRQQPRLQSERMSSLCSAIVVMLVGERGDAFFACAARSWYQRQACESVDRCLQAWHAHSPHGTDVRGRLMCSQAVEGQWSSHRVNIYDWTSRGPLLFIIVIMDVQWFATRRRA